jgi:hypothetical protein
MKRELRTDAMLEGQRLDSVEPREFGNHVHFSQISAVMPVGHAW